MSTSQMQLYFYSPEGLALIKRAGAEASVLLRAAGQALAQRDDEQAMFCAVDGQESVLQFSSCSLQYTVYGHDRDVQCDSMLRYSGQRKEFVTGHYLLGEGYRAYNPLLMRFNSSDSLSPFGTGGMNTYCYCNGDPVNNTDPSGHMKFPWNKTTRSAPATLTSYKSLIPSREQLDFNVNMNSRLHAHNNRVAYEKSYDHRLARHGRNTGKWVDVLAQRSSFTKNDQNLMTGVVVTVERDAQAMQIDLLQNSPINQQDPRIDALFTHRVLQQDVEQINARISASLAPRVDSWLHGKQVVKVRQAG